MAPKKPPTTHPENTNSSEEECDSSSAQRPNESATEIAHLRQLLQGFVDVQQRKDEELQKEAKRQDQRWRSLQHQFGLLQGKVRRGQRGAQQDAEAQQSQAAHARIYRPVAPDATEGELTRPALTGWPRLPQLKDSDDVEHYFVMFERLALAARWPRTDWAFHLVPLLEGELISRVGIPREILTDQGTNFTSKFMKNVSSLLGIKGIHTTPYHPQTDGLTERFNKTLKQTLRKLANSNGTDWDTWLPYVLFAYREVQASSGFSPFELLFSQQVRSPLDVLKEAWEGENRKQKLNILTHVLKMRDKMSQLTELVHTKMQKSQKHQKHWYDRAARKRVLQPGQKVLLLLPTSDTGLLAKWQGPYEMLRPWNEPDTKSSEQLWIRAVEEDEEAVEQYFPTGGAYSILPDVDHLSAQQQDELQQVIPPKLFSEEPGRTAVTQHNIRITKDEPIQQTT
ncbi:hypothetical protein NFI96_003643 [Prochilodus magdalenae]|nr:hypothetical protein NFI96_003643 [Prochilodus magdalenae]